MVEVELCKIVIAERLDHQVVVLREKDGGRQFPIAIGIHEAVAIDRGVKGIELPRPMTHDLIWNIIEGLDAELEKVVVSDLRDDTFFATLHIRQGDRVVEIDSRTSDAIASLVGVSP